MPADTSTAAPRFSALFTPKLVTVLREGYGLRDLWADLIAGLTVAVVALPLSMAIAIASGVTPAAGLYTAIIGGFLVSLLGGSRFQIGGPAGAFIVLVAGTVMVHGVDGLILATALSGLMLAGMGLLRLGSFIKFIPLPVTIGFTAGIAVIIFTSQIGDFLGLPHESASRGVVASLTSLWESRQAVTLPATLMGAAVVGGILSLRRWQPHWPGMLIAVAGAGLATAWGGVPVATIGSQFGGIPAGLPTPVLPEISWSKLGAVLPAAASFAMLGAIESLLSAVVADGMSGRRHRSNCELLAQGVANVGAALFGGFCVTGTIARTATNIRVGAHGPLAGIFHALFLLLFILVAAPLAAHIPLAALAGVLVVVSWDMIDRGAIRSLVKTGRGATVVLLTTLVLTISRGLIEGIVAGTAMGCLLFIRRMSRLTEVVTHAPLVGRDLDDQQDLRPAYASEEIDRGVVVYRITGALFFGTTASLSALLDRAWGRHHTLIIDFSAVPFVDASGASLMREVVADARRRKVAVWLTGTRPRMRQILSAYGMEAAGVQQAPDIETALRQARNLGQQGGGRGMGEPPISSAAPPP